MTGGHKDNNLLPGGRKVRKERQREGTEGWQQAAKPEDAGRAYKQMMEGGMTGCGGKQKKGEEEEEEEAMRKIKSLKG